MAFSPTIAAELWEYAGHRCSSPFCGGELSGPGRYGNCGEAAHIKGEKPGTARYDSFQPDVERHSPSNGIYLCVGCHRFVDRCEAAYPPELLHQWKEQAHRRYDAEIYPGRPRGVQGSVDLADNSRRAKTFLDRHRGFADEILRLFQCYSGRSSVFCPDTLRTAAWVTEPLMSPFFPARDDYCHEPQTHARQLELVRLVERIRASQAFRLSAGSKDWLFNLEYEDVGDGRRYKDCDIQLLAAYFERYGEFWDFWRMAPGGF